MGVRPGAGGRLVRHLRIAGGRIHKDAVAGAGSPWRFLVLQVMGMRPGTGRRQRTFRVGVAGDLAGRQRYRCRAARLFHRIEITVGGIDPHRHPARAHATQVPPK